MPDRLLEISERIAAKVAALDTVVKASGAKAERPLASVDGAERLRLGAAFQNQWEELAALVSQQHAMLGEMARRTQELSSLSAFLQTHYEREKASLARELHDQLGGILTPARMDLSWLQTRLGEDPVYAQRMARLSALIDQGIDLKRRIIENLRPSLLDHLGLAAAVQWYVDETCGAAKIKCRVTIAKLERLPSDLEIALYRVVQESVTNIIRHAQAKNVDLILERSETGLRVAVSDDGIGIADLESARGQAHGLAAMSQRMRAINGTLDIESRQGRGTRVEAFLPIVAQAGA
jgi:signal transduction histidine kinase